MAPPGPTLRPSGRPGNGGKAIIAMNEPDWVQHAIWWQVYPLGFVGAEKTATPEPAADHRLLDLVPWLDYAVKLGASGMPRPHLRVGNARV